jgi:hypothetical protein
MDQDVFGSILDVKSAMLERESHSVSVIRQELNCAQNLLESTLKLSGIPAGEFETGGALQAAMRFETAQIVRLEKLEKTILEIQERLDAAEESLRKALGEKRAVERLSRGL